MKPNLVVVQPPHIRLDSLVEQFCEDFCESHYVYLIRPDSAFREDSPAGVRFLSHPLDGLPGFGCVDTAIAVGDPEVAERLRECYPDSKLAVWHPRENGELPAHINSLLRPTVVAAEFGETGKKRRGLARAM
jgi:hypothetical protein